ncbi:MAG: hypothetical protein DRP18_01280 [Candidatus Aenigmatarchaeota archaeon]|nr:MAG: hypothetical protein DRP18_01280 [Candidatus Aenigmarchaeota archaeon]
MKHSTEQKILGACFWIMFLIVAGFILFGFIFQYFFIDVVFVLFLFLMGLTGLIYELNRKISEKEYNAAKNAIQDIYYWAQSTHSFAKDIKSKHERRLHSFDLKRAELHKKTEAIEKIFGKKLIELENKINKAIKTFERDMDMLERVEKIAKTLSEERDILKKLILNVNKKELETLKKIKEKGSMSTKEYREAFGVSPAQALNELNLMVQKGLLKKQGKGAGTRYVLAF